MALGIEWAGMEWPRSMDARQIADDWELAVSMDAECRDRAWIARNLGDVPMRIFDTVTNVTLTLNVCG